MEPVPVASDLLFNRDTAGLRWTDQQWHFVDGVRTRSDSIHRQWSLPDPVLNMWIDAHGIVLAECLHLSPEQALLLAVMGVPPVSLSVHDDEQRVPADECSHCRREYSASLLRSRSVSIAQDRRAHLSKSGGARVPLELGYDIRTAGGNGPLGTVLLYVRRAPTSWLARREQQRGISLPDHRLRHPRSVHRIPTSKREPNEPTMVSERLPASGSVSSLMPDCPLLPPLPRQQTRLVLELVPRTPSSRMHSPRERSGDTHVLRLRSTQSVLLARVSAVVRA